MTYRGEVASPGGVVVIRWSPPVATGTVLLLGQSPVAWQAAPAAPLALLAAGLAVLTVDTPNWGNSTDMAAVDAAVAWSGVDSVVALGYGDGAVVALNWALRHHDRAAGVVLVSPIIDLAERWTRVTADRTSLQNAYGGSQATFDAAMPTWNPAHLHRKHMVAQLLHGRLTVVASPAATDTPPAVTAALAATMLATPATIAQEAPTADEWGSIAGVSAASTGWNQAPAAEREILLRDWMDDSPSNQGFKGGDGYYGAALGSDEVYCTADNTVCVGPDADGTFPASTSIRRNAILRVVAGVVSQVYGAAGAIPLAPVTVGNWYWPLGVVIEDGLVRITCLELTPGAGFGEHVDNVVVTVNPATWAQTAAVGLGFTTSQIHSPFRDGPWIYMLSNLQALDDAEDLHTLSAETYIHRVEYGSMTSVAAWDTWDGGKWMPGFGTPAALTDTDGAPIDGSCALRRARAGFTLAAMGAFEGAIRLYVSPLPTGPFRLYDTVPVPTGTDRYDTEGVGYQPCFLPHLDPDSDGLMLSWCGNYFEAGSAATGDIDADWNRPNHLIVPAPSF